MNILKGLVLAAALGFLGCGGSFQPPPEPTPKVFTADQIFSNKAETWTFQNTYGDISTVEIQPVDETHTTWHYTKTAPEAYWGVSISRAELWFDLEKDSSGNWFSTGGAMSFPDGCSYCTSPFSNVRYSVSTIPGNPRPYLILPSKTGFAYQTVFDDTVPIGPDQFVTATNNTWKTSSYIEDVQTPVYSGPAYVSDQWEGPCIHEKWYFAPGLGMVKVEPILGFDACVPDDPNLVMVRIK